MDLSEIQCNLERAEVTVLLFPRFSKTLLLDLRCTRDEHPYVGVVPMVNSTEERLQELYRLRPEVEQPKALTVVPWLRGVAGLKASGVWELIIARLAASGAANAQRTLEQCYRELAHDEWVENCNAIRGSGYQTLWSRIETP